MSDTLQVIALGKKRTCNVQNFFNLAGTLLTPVSKKAKKAMDNELMEWSHNFHCLHFSPLPHLPPLPSPFHIFTIPLTRESVNVSTLQHNAYRGRCRSIGRIGINMAPAARQPWMVHFGNFFITTCHQTITASICRRGKPSSPPATIAAVNMIKVLLRTSLPFDPPLGSWGRSLWQQQEDPLSRLNTISLRHCHPS